MIGVIIMNSIISIILLVLIVLLQIFLSKNKNKYLGLILPGINIFYSLIAVLGFMTFDSVGSDGSSIFSAIIQGIMIFISFNIPAMILLAIYSACRKNISRNTEIDKMNIKDL